MQDVSDESIWASLSSSGDISGREIGSTLLVKIEAGGEEHLVAPSSTS